MATLHDIVVDCSRPAAQARFWSAVLDGYAIAPYDEAELARLAALGIHDVEDDPSVLVESDRPDAPRFFFQRVPEPKITKNRWHLDLRSADVSADVDRIRKLGGRLLDTFDDHLLLADPEGNEFCLLT